MLQENRNNRLNFLESRSHELFSLNYSLMIYFFTQRSLNGAAVHRVTLTLKRRSSFFYM